MQNPTSQLVFAKINCWHRPDQDVVKRNRNDRRDLVAATNPCRGQREQRLQRVERREAKENSEGGAERDRVRGIGNRHERHVVLDQPTLFLRQELWQSRTVTSSGGQL